MRNQFVAELTELAGEDERIVLLTGDLGFSILEQFSSRFPDRFINCGVAEQNMIGLATGLAEAGYVPFAYSIATFATLRPYEFIRNGQQALGCTAEVLDRGAVEAKFRGFGWRAEVVDGHDHEALAAALTRSQQNAGRPHVLGAATTFGKGVDFMAGRIEWHYRPLSAEQYEDAMRQLEAAGA